MQLQAELAVLLSRSSIVVLLFFLFYLVCITYYQPPTRTPFWGESYQIDRLLSQVLWF